MSRTDTRWTSTVLWLLALMGCLASPTWAQSLVVSSPVRLPAADSALPSAEVHLAVDPNDSRTMLAATIAFDSATSVWLGSRIDVLRTADGGEHWTRTQWDMAAGADPWVTIDARGNAYVSYLSQPRGESNVHLQYRTSRDGGRSWTQGGDLGIGHDREAMVSTVVDGTPLTFLSSSESARSPTGANLARVYVAKSVAGSPLEPIARLVPNNLQSNTLGLAATRGGAVVLTLLDYATSTFEMLDERRAWVLVTTDGGETFSEPRYVAGDLAPRTAFDIAADPSGRFAEDRLYALRLAEGEDGQASLTLSVSDDLGASWEDLGGIDEGLARPTPPFQLTVDENGVVYAAWFDGRCDSGGGGADLMIAGSEDGGVSFMPVQRVTPATSVSQVAANGQVAERFPTGGDYFGFAPRAGGGVHLLWVDSRSGVFQLYHATAIVRE